MSAVDTNTRILRPSAETRQAIAEGRIPDWQAPLITHRTHEGKHRLNEDLTTRKIPAGRIAALRERVQSVPVVSAPVHVHASSSPSKLAMLWSNLRGRR
jgi:hypothetical protein